MFAYNISKFITVVGGPWNVNLIRTLVCQRHKGLRACVGLLKCEFLNFGGLLACCRSKLIPVVGIHIPRLARIVGMLPQTSQSCACWANCTNQLKPRSQLFWDPPAHGSKVTWVWLSYNVFMSSGFRQIFLELLIVSRQPASQLQLCMHFPQYLFSIALGSYMKCSSSAQQAQEMHA